MFVGIWATSLGNWADLDYYYGGPIQQDPYPGLNDQWAPASFGGSSDGPHYLMFGFYSYAAAAQSTWRNAYLGGTIIQLTDPEAPTFTNPNMVGPTGWTKDATFTFAPSASDYGLGMRRLRLSAPGIADQDRCSSLPALF